MYCRHLVPLETREDNVEERGAAFRGKDSSKK